MIDEMNIRTNGIISVIIYDKEKMKLFRRLKDDNKLLDSGVLIKIESNLKCNIELAKENIIPDGFIIDCDFMFDKLNIVDKMARKLFPKIDYQENKSFMGITISINWLKIFKLLNDN